MTEVMSEGEEMDIEKDLADSLLTDRLAALSPRAAINLFFLPPSQWSGDPGTVSRKFYLTHGPLW